MQSRIKKKSMYDIVKQWGFPADLKEFEVTYRFDVSKEEIEKFKSQIIALSSSNKKQNKRKFDDYMRIIMQNEVIFDREIYLLHIARLLEQDYSVQYNSTESYNYTNKIFANIDFNDTAKKASLIRNAKGFLSEVDVADISINQDGELKIVSSLEFADQKEEIDSRKELAKKQLKEIDKKITLEKVLSFFKPEEFFLPFELEICRYGNLSYILQKEIENSENKKDKLIELVRKYIEYIDVNKMLVIANSRYYIYIKKDIKVSTYENILKLKEFTTEIEKIISNKNEKVIPYKFAKEITFEDIDKNINEIKAHFIGGKYYQDYEKDNLAKNIVNGKVDLNLFSRDDFENLRFSSAEISKMIIRNPTSIEFLVKNNFKVSKEIKEILEYQNQISVEQLIFALKSKVLLYKDILRLYYKDKITLKTIKKLKELTDDEKKLSELVSSKELIELLVSKNEKKAKKYIKLYKVLIIDGKEKNEIRKIANEILDYALDSLEEDKIYNLYYMGLIPIDILLDMLDEKNADFSKLLIEGIIKPVDIRNLYYEGIITEDKFNNLIKDMEDSEKLVLICSIFPDSEDEKQLEIRDKLLKNISPEIRELYGKKSENKEKSIYKKVYKNNNNFSDNCLKWKYISNLDKDFTQKYINDGMAIFYLPNKDTYIIEKLFAKNMKPVYGTATYTLDESDFKKYKKSIIDSKTQTINNKILSKLNYENNSVSKIVHTGWSDAISKYLM